MPPLGVATSWKPHTVNERMNNNYCPWESPLSLDRLLAILSAMTYGWKWAPPLWGMRAMRDGVPTALRVRRRPQLSQWGSVHLCNPHSGAAPTALTVGRRPQPSLWGGTITVYIVQLVSTCFNYLFFCVIALQMSSFQTHRLTGFTACVWNGWWYLYRIDTVKLHTPGTQCFGGCPIFQGIIAQSAL